LKNNIGNLSLKLMTELPLSKENRDLLLAYDAQTKRKAVMRNWLSELFQQKKDRLTELAKQIEILNAETTKLNNDLKEINEFISQDVYEDNKILENVLKQVVFSSGLPENLKQANARFLIKNGDPHVILENVVAKTSDNGSKTHDAL